MPYPPEIDMPYYELDVVFGDGTTTEVYIPGNSNPIASLSSLLFSSAQTLDTVASATLNFWGESTSSSYTAPSLVVNPAFPAAGSSQTVSPGSVLTYNFTLSSAPVATESVSVSIMNSNDSPQTDGAQYTSASPATLSFTSSNWNTPQQVTITVASSAANLGQNVGVSVSFNTTGLSSGGPSLALFIVPTS